MYEEAYGHDKDNLPLMMHSSKWIEKCYNHMIVPRKKKGDSKERRERVIVLTVSLIAAKQYTQS